MSKKFKNIFNTQEDFNSKVWKKVLEFGYSEQPIWLTDTKAYLNKNIIFNALSAKYNEIYTIDTEESFIDQLTLSLVHLLPEAYFKTLILKNDNLEKINWESILSTTTESGLDEGKKTFETFSASSSSPSNDNSFDNFDGEKASEKDYTRTTDNRLTIQNIKDVSKAILDIQTTPFSGILLNIVNHVSISTLFDYNLTEEDATVEVFKTIEAGPRGEKGEQGEQGERGEQGEQGPPGIITNEQGNIDLGEYYTKTEVDTRLNNLAAQSLSFVTNYMTSVEIKRDFLNKSVTDIQEVAGAIAGPKFINNSTNLPTANSNELSTTEYVDKEIEKLEKFKKTDHFTENSELLTSNDNILRTVTKLARIGYQYRGSQSYAEKARGSLWIGEGAEGAQYYSLNAKGTQHYALNALGNLTIGSAKWRTPESERGAGYLISGDIETTFKKIIDRVNEIDNSFVATLKTGSKLATISGTTNEFLNGGSITAGNSIKIEFNNDNFEFTETSNKFNIVSNDNKKLDLGEGGRKFLKVGVKVNSISSGSIGQLEIKLSSGNIDIGTENIVVLNPDAQTFYVKTFGILNSEVVKNNGISVTLKSQTATFNIGGFELILL